VYAVQLTGPGQWSLIETDRPVPREDELLIRVHRVGICGTDIEMLKGTMPYFRLGWTKYPVVLGHEWSGTVADTGSAVEKFERGDRVTGDVTIGCGTCEPCMNGSYNLCVIKQEVGLCRGKDGAFAQYLTMPARHCYSLPEDVSLDAGALVEPAATVVKAIRKAGMEPGALALITGDGPIGLLAAQAALAYGAGWVVLAGTEPTKLELGKKLGVHRTVDVTRENLHEVVMDETRARGVDLALEASGNGQALNACMDCARQGGTVSVVGLYEEPIEKLDMGLAVARDLSLICSIASPNTFTQTLRMMATGKIQVEPLVTHVLSLEEAGRAFEIQQTAPTERIKIHLEPPFDE
jgi:2-desacetyl-2-hydroxyethyl bacteriochlorophyllide A dehydrogenase